MPWLVGYSRNEVNWHPTIDDQKCLKCGMCMNCGKKVFQWEHNKPVVANPLDCVVGCNTCSNLCLGQAISFPDIEVLRNLYRENDIWSKVKDQLIKDKVIQNTKE